MATQPYASGGAYVNRTSDFCGHCSGWLAISEPRGAGRRPLESGQVPLTVSCVFALARWTSGRSVRLRAAPTICS